MSLFTVLTEDSLLYYHLYRFHGTSWFSVWTQNRFAVKLFILRMKTTRNCSSSL